MPERIGFDTLDPPVGPQIEPQTESTTESEKASREQNQNIGAAALSSVNFETHQKPIVESSFNKAIASKEKLHGNSSRRRNEAYLNRIESLTNKYGNDLEKKLWQASSHKLIISPDDIQDSYWKTQEQILRDNGQSRELSNYEKNILTQDIQRQQKESLESWSTYLGDKDSPYPMWFKIYAWDGMSKMGTFNKDKRCFNKRDRHTVAPYPRLNPAVLAKTYAAVSTFYGHDEKDRYAEDSERNRELEELVGMGNFNKLYSKILLEQKIVPKTPEHTEDVRGEWVEYLPGDEEKLAEAAEGTPWCVADPGTGRNYLEYGNYQGANDYGDDDDYYDEDYEEDYDGIQEDQDYTPRSYADNSNKAKFILFHLQDPETGILADNACASVRLGPDGNVAEISGLNDGQALEDSLVPIVEEKVKSLPGGERFLQAFADKQTLIRLDRKMQNREDLTTEDLEFIFEMNREIVTLDTYNGEDPRIKELRNYLPLEEIVKKGIPADAVAYYKPIEEIVSNAEMWQKNGLNMSEFLSNQYAGDKQAMIRDYKLLSKYIDVKSALKDMSWQEFVRCARDLVSSGLYNKELLEKCCPKDAVVANLKLLMNAGIPIEDLIGKTGLRGKVKINRTTEEVVPDVVDDPELLRTASMFDYYLYYCGCRPMDMVNICQDRELISENYNKLIPRTGSHAPDEYKELMGTLLEKILPNTISQRHYAEEFLDCCPLNQVLEKTRDNGLSWSNIRRYIERDVENNNKIDVNLVLSKIDHISDYFGNNDDIITIHTADENGETRRQDISTSKYFLENGANPDLLLSKFNSPRLSRNKALEFLKYGANPDDVVDNIDDSYRIMDDYVDVNDGEQPALYEVLLKRGASPAKVISKMNDYQVSEHCDRLLSIGASPEDIIDKFDKYDKGYVIRNLSSLLSAGANIDVEGYMDEVPLDTIVNNADQLVASGIDINNIVDRLERVPRIVVENLSKLTENGADIDISNLCQKLQMGWSSENAYNFVRHELKFEEVVRTLIDNGATLEDFYQRDYERVAVEILQQRQQQANA